MPETTEFDDLAAQLHAERPRIDPAFARDLDARAAAGFPRKRRRRRLPRLRGIPLYVPATALAVVAALAVTAGVIGSSRSDTDGGSAVDGAVARKPSAGSSSRSRTERSPLNGAGGAVRQPGGIQAASPSGRVQEQSASMTLVAPAADVSAVGDRIIGVADQVGGFVVSSDVRATDATSGGGDFQLRVPSARLGDALARLSRLAHVRERQQGIQDITAERNSARDQLAEALAERRSLLRLLGAASTDNQVTSLRARLRDVNGTITSDRGALKRVTQRADYATVVVSLAAQPRKGAVTPPDDHRWTPADAARDAGRVLEVVAGLLLLGAAVLAPLGLLGAAALSARRYGARRDRERALDAS